MGGDPGSPDDYLDFWAPDPPCWTWRDILEKLGLVAPSALRRRGVAAITALLVLCCLTPLSPVTATMTSPALAAVPAVPTEDLDTLVSRADALSEEYNGELLDMEAVIDDAEQAKERAEKTEAKVETARKQVRQLAIASYTSGGLEPALTLFVENQPQDVIDRAQVVDHLSTANQDRIDQLQQAIARDKEAQKNAEEKVAAVKEDLEELEERRKEVQEMIADHPNQQMGGPDNLTPRTRQMRDLIIEEFGEGTSVGGVGCYRPYGGWVIGEHPKGRACDFMLNANGQIPSQEQIDRGYAIAEWAQDNADRLGIMYIIYRQEIWDIRRGSEGWRPMADRGSITENHYDHVHISMF
ncbi:coiled-coil domain-containing protein [Salinactinospora qingdaonensis]